MARVFFFLLAVAIVAGTLFMVYRYIEEGPYTRDEQPDVPSADEIVAELRPVLAPVRALLAIDSPVPGSGLRPADRDAMVEAFRDAKVAYGETESGQAAFRRLSREIVSLAQDAGKAGRWRLVQALVDVHDLLEMDSLVLARLDESATKRLAQPIVRVRGVMEDLEQETTYVFLHLLDRETQELTREKARVGDVVGDLRVVEIIGRNKTVVFEYLPIEGLTFEVDFS